MQEGSVAEVALAGLVQEGGSGMARVARDLLPGAVLALDAVAAQMAPLCASLTTLDPSYLGDLGQGSSPGGRTTPHPDGHGAMGDWNSSWFSHPAEGDRGAVGEKKSMITVFSQNGRQTKDATKTWCVEYLRHRISPHAARQANDALLSHHRQVAIGDHGQVARGDVDRHAGVLYEQVLHGAGLCCGSFCSETGGRGDKPALIHAASL